MQLHLGLHQQSTEEKLEPQLGEVEKKAEELTEASRAAVSDAVKRLESLPSPSDYR